MGPIVKELIKADIWVTVDSNAKYCEQVLEYGWDEYNKFVAMISVIMSMLVSLITMLHLKLMTRRQGSQRRSMVSSNT